jgi:hypothetical protein
MPCWQGAECNLKGGGVGVEFFVEVTLQEACSLFKSRSLAFNPGTKCISKAPPPDACIYIHGILYEMQLFLVDTEHFCAK